MKTKNLGNIIMYLGVIGVGCHLLTMPKYLFFRDLILKTISSVTSDLKQLISEWSNFRFTKEVVPLGRDHTVRFFAQFSGINRVKRRAIP